MKTYLMLKDTPVLEIDGYNCVVKDSDRLPVSLRYSDVNYDDVMHNWTNSRCISLSRTYAKNLTACFHGIRKDPYSLAALYHFASLTDSYWIKEENENLTWKDVSLFRNEYDKNISKVALTGEYTDFSFPYGKMHTPEATTQGLSAKCWVREKDGLYLYKIGRKEIPASRILDQLQIPHVSYTAAKAQDLVQVASEERIKKIHDAGEIVTRCPIITSEDISLVTWEDVQIYCDRNGVDPFSYVKGDVNYAQMQIADYILGNEDRHEQNWGFLMKNETGELLGLHPLMDHDHSFSNEPYIPSQTSENKETLEEAAAKALRIWQPAATLERPPCMTDEEWKGVSERLYNVQIFFKW